MSHRRMSWVRRFTLALVGVVATGLLLGGAAPAGAQVATPVPAVAGSIPGTHVGARIDWLLAELNAGLPTLTKANAGDYFTDGFLTALPPDQLLATLGQFAAIAPLTFLGVVRPPTDQQAIALIGTGAGLTFVSTFAVDPAEPDRLAYLAASRRRRTFVRCRRTPRRPPLGSTTSVAARCTSGAAEAAARRSSSNPDTPRRRRPGSASRQPSRRSPPSAATTARIVPVGRATPVATPRTGIDVVHDLHALLETAGVPGPYVVRRPLDRRHLRPPLRRRVPRRGGRDGAGRCVARGPGHAREGIGRRRLWETFEAQGEGSPIPRGSISRRPSTRCARPAPPARCGRCRSSSSRQGIGPDPSLFPAGWPVDADEALYRELQDDLASLVPNVRHVIAAESGHFIHGDQPDLVIEAIRDVVGAVRDPATWSTPPASPIAA